MSSRPMRTVSAYSIVTTSPGRAWSTKMTTVLGPMPGNMSVHQAALEHTVLPPCRLWLSKRKETLLTQRIFDRSVQSYKQWYRRTDDPKEAPRWDKVGSGRFRNQVPAWTNLAG
jgi:hypothetical protein